MQVALLNGSPKGENSASQVILDLAEAALPDSFSIAPLLLKTPKVDKTTVLRLASCDLLVWAFPLYVDAVPSHLLPWLSQLEKWFLNSEKVKPKVYALINCGFYEAEQNEIALEILRNWCAKAGLSWGQGMGIGAGGVFLGLKNISFGRWPFGSLARFLRVFSANLTLQKSGPDLFVSPDFPRFGYKLAAEFSWRRAVKRNGLKLKDLHRKIVH